MKAAQKAAAFEDQENETVVVKEKMVGGIAQVSFAPSPLRDTVSRAVTLPVLVPTTPHPNAHACRTESLISVPQIIAAQEEMLRKERELEEARKKLAQIRQQQYKFLPSELRDEH